MNHSNHDVLLLEKELKRLDFDTTDETIRNVIEVLTVSGVYISLWGYMTDVQKIDMVHEAIHELSLEKEN